MKKKTSAIEQRAGRDVANRISVDLRIDEGAALDQRISIGTVITGPVHVHLVIDRAPPKADAE